MNEPYGITRIPSPETPVKPDLKSWRDLNVTERIWRGGGVVMAAITVGTLIAWWMIVAIWLLMLLWGVTIG